MGGLHKNTGDPPEYIRVPTLFLLYIYELPCDVICKIAISADDTTLYCFITILGVTEMLCSFRLVLERKTGKLIPKSSRLEF